MTHEGEVANSHGSADDPFYGPIDAACEALAPHLFYSVYPRAAGAPPWNAVTDHDKRRMKGMVRDLLADLRATSMREHGAAVAAWLTAEQVVNSEGRHTMAFSRFDDRLCVCGHSATLHSGETLTVPHVCLMETPGGRRCRCLDFAAVPKLTDLQRLVFKRLAEVSDPVLPPWLTADAVRPSMPDRDHPSTQAYGQALAALAKKGVIEVDWSRHGYIGSYRIRWWKR